MFTRSGVRKSSFAVIAARALLIGVVVVSSMASRCGTETMPTATEIGTHAFNLTKELVAIGPRPSGSTSLQKARDWIRSTAEGLGYGVEVDSFDAKTPIGTIEMKNLSYRIPGRSSAERVLLLAHYESKRFAGFDFVGANDSASSVGLLLALSKEIQNRKYPFETEVVFVDGEEALVRWSSTDGLYGSKHLASGLASGKPVRGAIVIDMISDFDLLLVRDANVDVKLMKTLEQVLAARGWSALLDAKPMLIDDDHTPLIARGIPTYHLMDFTFGGKESPGTYWHTPEDTIDKVSVVSLSVVGEVLLDLLGKF